MKEKYIFMRNMLRGGIFILLLYHRSSDSCKRLIKEDVCAIYKRFSKALMLQLLFEESHRTFRSILYYRFRKDGLDGRLLRFTRHLIKPVDSIEIGGNIDGGLKILHNYCVISVKRAIRQGLLESGNSEGLI